MDGDSCIMIGGVRGVGFEGGSGVVVAMAITAFSRLVWACSSLWTLAVGREEEKEGRRDAKMFQLQLNM